MNDQLMNTPNDTQHYFCRFRLVVETSGAQLNEPTNHKNKCVCNKVIDEGQKQSIRPDLNSCSAVSFKRLNITSPSQHW